MLSKLVNWFKDFWAKIRRNTPPTPIEYKHEGCKCDDMHKIEDEDFKNIEIDFSELKEVLGDLEKKVSKPNRSKKSMKKIKKVCKKKREI